MMIIILAFIDLFWKFTKKHDGISFLNGFSICMVDGIILMIDGCNSAVMIVFLCIIDERRIAVFLEEFHKFSTCKCSRKIFFGYLFCYHFSTNLFTHILALAWNGLGNGRSTRNKGAVFPLLILPFIYQSPPLGLTFDKHSKVLCLFIEFFSIFIFLSRWTLVVVN